MATYLEERGDIPFAQDGFNEVDNLLLAFVAFVDFEGVVPAPPSGSSDATAGDLSGAAPGQGAAPASAPSVTVREAAGAFFARHGEQELLASRSLFKEAPFFLRSMAQGRRFAYLRLSHYVSKFDPVTHEQFAALVIDLDDGDNARYVAFRGTDDTLVGWREDVALSYQVIPAQIEAACYLRAVLQESAQPLYLGGHSKGGNLACYAALECADALAPRLLALYDNDGPGLSSELVSSSAYQTLRPKIRRIVPQYDVVGMLLEHDVDVKIIASQEQGVLQHACVSWEIEGTELVTAPQFDPQAVLLVQTIQGMLQRLTPSECVSLEALLFDGLEAQGLTYLWDVTDLDTRELLKTIGYRNLLQRDARKIAGAVLSSYLHARLDQRRSS